MKKLLTLLVILPLMLVACADSESGVPPGADGPGGVNPFGGMGGGNSHPGLSLGAACQDSYNQMCIEYYYSSSVPAGSVPCPYDLTQVDRCPRGDDFLGACLGPVVENGPAKVAVDTYYYEGGYPNTPQGVKDSCSVGDATYLSH